MAKEIKVTQEDIDKFVAVRKAVEEQARKKMESDRKKYDKDI